MTAWWTVTETWIGVALATLNVVQTIALAVIAAKYRTYRNGAGS